MNERSGADILTDQQKAAVVERVNAVGRKVGQVAFQAVIDELAAGGKGDIQGRELAFAVDMAAFHMTRQLVSLIAGRAGPKVAAEYSRILSGSFVENARLLDELAKQIDVRGAN